jgi:hypothetical protein
LGAGVCAGVCVDGATDAVGGESGDPSDVDEDEHEVSVNTASRQPTKPRACLTPVRPTGRKVVVI